MDELSRKQASILVARGQFRDQELHRLAEAVAEIRQNLHKNHKSQMILSENSEIIGLVGELCFSKIIGIPADLSDKPAGDGKFDFDTKAGKIDVKTANKANNLLIPEGKIVPDIIYVLAQYSNPTAYFKGWIESNEMFYTNTDNFGAGFKSHFKPVRLLKPMDKLYKRMGLKLPDYSPLTI